MPSNAPKTDFGQCRKTPNWEMRGKKYVVISNTGNCPQMTWAEASDYCQSLSMSLVSMSQSLDPNMANDILNIPKVLASVDFGQGDTLPTLFK